MRHWLSVGFIGPLGASHKRIRGRVKTWARHTDRVAPSVKGVGQPPGEERGDGEGDGEAHPGQAGVLHVVDASSVLL